MRPSFQAPSFEANKFSSTSSIATTKISNSSITLVIGWSRRRSDDRHRGLTTGAVVSLVKGANVMFLWY